MSRGYHSGGNLCLTLCTTSTSQPDLQVRALVRPAICFSDKNYGKNHFLLFAFEKWTINRYIHFVLRVCSYFLNIRLLLQEQVKILFNSCNIFLWDKEISLSLRQWQFLQGFWEKMKISVRIFQIFWMTKKLKLEYVHGHFKILFLDSSSGKNLTC